MFPLGGPAFPFCVSSSCPVLCFSCRITLRFDVLGWSLMYLNPLVRLVSDNRSFPLASISLCVPSRPQVSFLVLKSQRRFSAAEQVRVCLVNEDLPPLVFPFSSHLLSSSIAFASLYSTCMVSSLLDRSLACFSTHSLPLSTRICLATPCEILHLTNLSRFTRLCHGSSLKRVTDGKGSIAGDDR